MIRPHDAALSRFEAAASSSAAADYEFTLYVSGASRLAGRAIANARRLCEEIFGEGYHLDVVDVHRDPARATDWLLAVPTMVRDLPLPARKVVGDLSDTARVIRQLGLPSPADVLPDSQG